MFFVEDIERYEKKKDMKFIFLKEIIYFLINHCTQFVIMYNNSKKIFKKIKMQLRFSFTNLLTFIEMFHEFILNWT